MFVPALSRLSLASPFLERRISPVLPVRPSGVTYPEHIGQKFRAELRRPASCLSTRTSTFVLPALDLASTLAHTTWPRHQLRALQIDFRATAANLVADGLTVLVMTLEGATS
jgi:hypothetical protein